MQQRDVRVWSPWWQVSALAVLALAVMAGCGGDDGGTEPEPEAAEVEVVVTADGEALSGVSVSLFEAGSTTSLATRSTDSGGSALFTGLEAGSYEVEVEIPEDHELADGGPARRSVTAQSGSRSRVEVGLREVETGVVEITLTSGLRFEPSDVTISPGTTVRWVNGAAMFHTITPDGHSEWERQELSSDGETFTHEFTGAGTFEYFCEPHESSGMTGSITVEQ